MRSSKWARGQAVCNTPGRLEYEKYCSLQSTKTTTRSEIITRQDRESCLKQKRLQINSACAFKFQMKEVASHKL